ncbi:Foldase protein PrsA precursor [Lachnospiraceae bacterium TWA4]|nr:Foldase protein PrsA precursor [Lachnospiraceae bacterium TWA4]
MYRIRGLIVILAMICLCRCTNKQVKLTVGLSGNQLFKVGDQVCTKEEALVYATAQKKLIEDAYGNGIWKVSTEDIRVEDYVKNSLKDFLAQEKCIHQMAIDHSIVLAQQEELLARSCANQYMEELTENEKSQLKITDEQITKIYEEYILVQKVESELTKDKVAQISDNDARVMQANVLKLDKSDDNKKLAQTVLKRVQSGEKFEELAKRYTKLEEVSQKISRNQYETEFDEVAFTLTDGQISNIIETDSAYYIISCIKSYDKEATKAHKAEMEQTNKKEVFDSIYKEYVDKLNAQFNGSVWNDLNLEDIPLLEKADFFKIYNTLVEQ